MRLTEQEFMALAGAVSERELSLDEIRGHGKERAALNRAWWKIKREFYA